MLETLAAPTALPVSLATAKTWLRETSTDWDADITDMLAAAFDYAETICHNAIVYRPVREQFDSFYPLFELSGFPARGVKSITYLDTSGVSQTLPAANYLFDVTKGQVRMTPAYALYFPPTRPIMNAVQVTYDIGEVCPITAVDTVGNKITATGANPIAGAIVQFSIDANGGAVLPAPLAAGTPYYVVNPVGDVFQVSATSGGGAIPITSQGSGAMFLGLLDNRIKQALRLILRTWYDFGGDVTTAQLKQMPVHGVEALLSPLMPRGF